MPTQNESVWLAVRYFLNQIVEDQENAMNYLHAIIELEREWGRIELFERPDCDRYFTEMKERLAYAGSSYAAQGWGIEKLYGLYYSSDDWEYKRPLIFRNRWLAKMEEKQRQDVTKEAKIVLKRFYSINDTLPDRLSGLDEFK